MHEEGVQIAQGEADDTRNSTARKWLLWKVPIRDSIEVSRHQSRKFPLLKTQDESHIHPGGAA
jgi:hypothetical protein